MKSTLLFIESTPKACCCNDAISALLMLLFVRNLNRTARTCEKKFHTGTFGRLASHISFFTIFKSLSAASDCRIRIRGKSSKHINRSFKPNGNKCETASTKRFTNLKTCSMMIHRFEINSIAHCVFMMYTSSNQTLKISSLSSKISRELSFNQRFVSVKTLPNSNSPNKSRSRPISSKKSRCSDCTKNISSMRIHSSHRF